MMNKKKLDPVFYVLNEQEKKKDGKSGEMERESTVYRTRRICA